MEIIFKKTSLEDLKETIELCNEVFEETTNLEFAKKVFESTENDPNQIYINGYVDGKIIAHTKLTIIPTIYEEMNTYAIINHFCVKKEYRRQHIGIKLLEEIMVICKEKNCTSIKLWSKNFRIPAHSCYDKFGFKKLDAGFFEKEV